MSIEGRETIVRIGYGANAEVSIWTTERAVFNKCKRAGWRMAQESLNKRGSVVGQEWVSSANNLTLSVKKPGRGKIMTGFALRPGAR